MAFIVDNIKPFEKRVYLASPTMHGDELKWINDAFNKNWISTLGENINEVEKQIAEKIGCKYAVGLACGTSALHMAIKLAGIKEGDKVFCSDMTFSATVNPVTYENGEQIFIDSEYDTWNMDPVALEKAFELYPDVKVVVMANLYGTPAKLDEIKAICKKHNAFIVEDAAESFGATFKGVQTGLFGDVGVISFNGNKIITGSCGGMLLTNNIEDVDKVRKWSTQARDTAPWYQHSELGYNYRMSNIIAGIIRGQIPHIQEHIALKKIIYDRYKEGLKGLPISMNPYDEKNSSPNFWLSCLIIDNDAMCKQVRDDYNATYVKEHGKSCPTEILDTIAKFNAEGRPIWKPMHMQPIYKNCDCVTRNGSIKKVGESVGEDVFARGLCLPSDIKMTKDEQDRIIEIIRRCFD